MRELPHITDDHGDPESVYRRLVDGGFSHWQALSLSKLVYEVRGDTLATVDYQLDEIVEQRQSAPWWCWLVIGLTTGIALTLYLS